jgi:hypothetical protein
VAKKNLGPGDWFIKQRTLSLATVYLTRRGDLLVSEAPKDSGLDLEVVIKRKEPCSQRKFGVILKATKEDLTINQANAILKPTLDALGSQAFTQPVCLFFFRMANDAGYYTWVTEPIVADDGSPALEHHDQAVCVGLDTEAINAIVESVVVWYDAFCRDVKAGNGRPKRTGLALLHGIVDAEAAFFSHHGRSPALLHLPVLQAYELAKLGREHLGDLAGRIVKDGVRVLEKEGLFGMKVTLVPEQEDFSLE